MILDTSIEDEELPNFNEAEAVITVSVEVIGTSMDLVSGETTSKPSSGKSSNVAGLFVTMDSLGTMGDLGIVDASSVAPSIDDKVGKSVAAVRLLVSSLVASANWLAWVDNDFDVVAIWKKGDELIPSNGSLIIVLAALDSGSEIDCIGSSYLLPTKTSLASDLNAGDSTLEGDIVKSGNLVSLVWLEEGGEMGHVGPE